ncbi:hypothetical protein [Acidaminococcus timonensis]|uniref:hypothetical protein n=1 Tax=Acidaminococcus timonensis TaxID=1871002 RepID=UPI00307BE69B
MTRTASFRFEGRLPCMNDIINVARTNRYGSAKLKKNTQEQLEWVMKATLAKDNRLGMQFPGHVVVEVQFYEDYGRNHRRDDDNVIGGGCKFILDAMQEIGLIKNDSPKYCHLKAERFTDFDGDPYILVKVTED